MAAPFTSMASLSGKSISNISRWRLRGAKHFLSGNECHVQRPAVNLENCINISKNSCTGLKSTRRLMLTPVQGFHSQRLIQDSWINGVTAETIISQENQKSNQYVCPSRLTQLFSQIVINDGLSNIKPFYDCPVTSYSEVQKITPSKREGDVLDLPTNTVQRQPSKKAKEIMRIRHKKMKKHKLKKLRKRMYFLWKKQKATRKAKRDAIYWKEINDIKQEAKAFNAETYVKEQLQKARKGGFYLNVFDSKA